MHNYRSIWLYLYDVPHRLGFADVRGVRTRYLEAGDPAAPPLLLLHGTAGSLENFCANIRAYAEHFHVCAIDMLGCGLTDKPDYPYVVPMYAAHARDFMDVMGFETASIVGVSLGSWVAVRMAHDFPGRVDRIVMVAPAGIIPDRKRFDDYVAGMMQRRTTAAGDPTWQSLRAVFAHLMLRDEDVIDDLVAIRLAIYSNPAMKRAMPYLLEQAKGEFSLEDDEWRALPNPILAIAAIDKDDMFLAHARRIGEIAPHATVIDLPDCDHWAQFEQAEIFNALSIRFLKGETISGTVDRSTTSAVDASGRMAGGASA